MLGGILNDQPFSIPLLMSFLLPWKQWTMILSCFDSSRISTASASAFLVCITMGLFRSLATSMIFLNMVLCFSLRG